MLYSLNKLLDIIAQLRHPDQGCPWDKLQTLESLKPYTLEEAYEVVDAIDKQDMKALKEELGDLLLQIVLQAQIASETKHFSFNDIVDSLSKKLIERHPHVFADIEAKDEQAVNLLWEEQKAKERTEKAQHGLLEGIALALPALIRAEKIQKRMAKVGFDWQEKAPLFDKIQEEIAEVQQALQEEDQAAIMEEIGDLLFIVVNLARHCQVDAEQALKQANHKVISRFTLMEMLSNMPLSELSLDELEALWQQAKLKLK